MSDLYSAASGNARRPTKSASCCLCLKPIRRPEEGLLELVGYYELALYCPACAERRRQGVDITRKEGRR